MNVFNARIGYEPQRGDGALCISFKDKKEAIFFAEAILHEVQNIENDGLSVSECASSPSVSARMEKKNGSNPCARPSPDRIHNVLVSVPDRN